MNKMKTYFLLKNYTDTPHKEHKEEEHEYKMSLHEIIDKWAKNMKNEDGTIGPHWTLAQTKEVAEKNKFTKYNEHIWYITMNMMYSDYCKVIQKLGVDPVIFSSHMADAFLNDIDSVPAEKKIEEYYEHIVKH